MKGTVFFAVAWLALSAAAVAQEGFGAMAGKVTDAGGRAVTGMTVEAKNTASGTVYKVALSPQGEYTLGELPAGAYDVSIDTPAFGAFKERDHAPYSQKGVQVQPGQTLHLDVALKIGGNMATLGDHPVALIKGMRARTTIPTGPTPRMPNGNPDLSGVWLPESEGEQAPPTPLQPWAEKIRKERQEKQTPSPLSLCLPASPIPFAQSFPFQLVQNHSMVVMLNDLDFPGWSQIFVDGRPHPSPQAWNPAWFGHAIGTWEGDTLVVDVVGFNDQSILGGGPHTEQLHVTERFRRPDAGHLEVDITAEDPGAFTGPYRRRVTATLGGKDEQILEYLCENNVFPQHGIR